MGACCSCEADFVRGSRPLKLQVCLHLNFSSFYFLGRQRNLCMFFLFTSLLVCPVFFDGFAGFPLLAWVFVQPFSMLFWFSFRVALSAAAATFTSVLLCLCLISLHFFLVTPIPLVTGLCECMYVCTYVCLYVWMCGCE